MSTPTACLAGEWTIHAIAQQREALLALVNDGQTEFDASGVTEMDTSGLQLVLAAKNTIAKQGGEIHLLQCSSTVRDALRAYGLDANLLPIVTEEAAS